MDGKAFISEVEAKLIPISPIIAFVIKKQLAEIGTTPEVLSPPEAVKFIDNMTEALEMFLGKDDAAKQRSMMVSLLRKKAPDYFKGQSLI